MKNVTTSPTLAELTRRIREVNIEKGWRAPDGGPCPGQTFSDYIALLHSEVSEALEAYRDHRLEDATEPYDLLDPDTNQPIPAKPEGVGSELADAVIRLLDMADVFGTSLDGVDDLPGDHGIDMDRPLSEVWPMGALSLKVDGFGALIAALHDQINGAWKMRPTEGPALARTLRLLVRVAELCEIDIEREVVRKVAFNRTRAFQHGGRTLAEPPVPVGTGVNRPVLEILLESFPTDARGWWTGEEADEFIDVWNRLQLPRLTMGDGQGEHYLFWCKNAEVAAGMLGVEYDEAEGFRIESGEYSVGIVQAEKK